MTDEELDALMRHILIDSIKIDSAEEDDAVNFEPSFQYQRQVKAMLKDPLSWARRKSRPIWKTVMQRVAMILLVISLGFATLMVTSPTARAVFIRWVTEWYETHITYRYAGEDILGIIPRYEITGLPEGYFEYEREETTSYTQIIYRNSDNRDRIRLSYIRMQQGSATDFVIEDVEVITVTVNGMVGELYVSMDFETEDSTVTWTDEETNLQFIVDAPFGEKEILRIAESVFLEEYFF